MRWITGATAAALMLTASSVHAVDYRQGSPGQMCAALTFDDGPDPTLTPQLLDLLRSEGVAATFFLVGEHVQANPGLARRELAEGFEIGNHSWDHPVLAREHGPEIASQWAETDAAIHSATGIIPAIVRPPYGATNDRVEAAAGRPAILWSIATLDWMGVSPDFAIHRALSHAEPGMIVLMHDVQPIVLDEARGIIEGLRAEGYGFSTVSGLLVGAPCH